MLGRNDSCKGFFLLAPTCNGPQIGFCTLDGTTRQLHGNSFLAQAKVQTEHGLSLSDYRHSILETAMVSFPMVVNAQTHRIMGHRYRQHISDAAFTFKGCACCARRCVERDMVTAIFPPASCCTPPQWLEDRGWTLEHWLDKGVKWFYDLHRCFSVDTYLQQHFHAQDRLDEAQRAARSSPEDTTAARFVDRVKIYIQNMRNDLLADAVAAPGGWHGPWASAYHPRWLFLRCSVSSTGEGEGRALEASVCRACATVMAKKPLESTKSSCGSYKHLLPPGARADGFWGGPVPSEIEALSLAGKKIIRLAHVCCCVLRVTLGAKQYHTMKSLGAVVPEFHTGNVLAKPQYSPELELILGVKPFVTEILFFFQNRSAEQKL